MIAPGFDGEQAGWRVSSFERRDGGRYGSFLGCIGMAWHRMCAGSSRRPASSWHRLRCIKKRMAVIYAFCILAIYYLDSKVVFFCESLGSGLSSGRSGWRKLQCKPTLEYE